MLTLVSRKPTQVVWIRRMLPPRAAPAQLCGVLSGHGELADGKTHVRYTSTPLVPLEYRVGTYGEVRPVLRR